MYIRAVQELIRELGRLPGVGPKSAQRIAFFILQNRNFDVDRLSDAIRSVRQEVHFCDICGNFSEDIQCAICLDPQRDKKIICVVEEPKDVVAIERTREFSGLYHVLGGAISPIDGVGPENLSIKKLLQRLADGTTKEVVLATDPNIEGEATAVYIARLLSSMQIKVSKLASGLPVGSDLEYADEVTLGRAFEGRRYINRDLQ